MKFNRIVVLLVLVALLLAVVPAFAQEKTAVPTEVATEEVTPEVTVVPAPTDPAPVEEGPIVADEVNFRLGIFGILSGIGMLILSGFGIGAIWGHTRASKQAKDQIEQALNALSPDAQQRIDAAHNSAEQAWNRVDEIAREFFQFIKEVRDGQPNVEGAPDFTP